MSIFFFLTLFLLFRVTHEQDFKYSDFINQASDDTCSGGISRCYPGYRRNIQNAVVHYNGYLYLFMGYFHNTIEWVYLSDNWKYEIESETWSMIKSGPSPYEDITSNQNGVHPGSRAFHGIIQHDGEMYLYGGKGFAHVDGTKGELCDFWRYRPLHDDWLRIHIDGQTCSGNYVNQASDALYPGSQRDFSFSVARTGPKIGKIYMFGGYGGETIGSNCELWEFDIDQWSWLNLNGEDPAKHCFDYHGSAPTITGTHHFPGNRYAHSAAITGDYMYIFGGLGSKIPFSTDTFLCDFWKYQFSTNSWTFLSACHSSCSGYSDYSDVAGHPGNRLSYAFEIYLDELYMWGGKGYTITGFSNVEACEMWKSDISVDDWMFVPHPSCKPPDYSADSQVGNWTVAGFESGEAGPKGRYGQGGVVVDQTLYLFTIAEWWYYDIPSNKFALHSFISCHEACHTCFGKGSDECWTCNNGYYWDDPYNTDAPTGTCVNTCSGGVKTFVSNANGDFCQSSCDVQCDACEGDGSNCLVCSGLYEFWNDPSNTGVPTGVCTFVCESYPNRFVWNHNYCQTCAPQCSTCQIESDLCLDCAEGFFWDDPSNAGIIPGDSCVDFCDVSNGRFLKFIDDDKFCFSCGSECRNCEGSFDNCEECESGFLWDDPENSGAATGSCIERSICVEEEEGRFENDGYCQSCSHECATCAGIANICLSCSRDYVWNDKTASQGVPTGSCILEAECSSSSDASGGGYFVNNGEFCQACHSKCLECDGPTENDCVSNPQDDNNDNDNDDNSQQQIRKVLGISLGVGGGVLALVLIVVVVAITIFVTVAISISRKKRKRRGGINTTADEVMEREMNSSASLKINSSMFSIDYDEINVKKTIGKGGSSSIVFLAEWNKQEVAFKCFKMEEFTDNGFGEFEREVGVMGNVSHPSILRFFGATLKPRVGIIMEYCAHGDINNYLKDHNDVSIETRINWLKEIASGMEYLHKRKIIHRDLKGENILLTASLNTRIMDFGLSRIFENMQQSKTSAIGTSHYMAPEVTLGGNYNELCDVFSFGIMMFEIVTGNLKPFGENVQFRVELKIANEPDFRPDVGEIEDLNLSPEYNYLGELMENCWKDDPSMRRSMTEIGQVLESGVIKALKKKIVLV